MSRAISTGMNIATKSGLNTAPSGALPPASPQARLFGMFLKTACNLCLLPFMVDWYDVTTLALTCMGSRHIVALMALNHQGKYRLVASVVEASSGALSCAHIIDEGSYVSW